MKLAIIMSGMLRNFEHTFFTTEKFILNDTFFESKDIFFAGYSGYLKLEEAEERFVNLYKPKEYVIQNWGKDIEDEINEVTGFKDWEITNKSSNLKNVISSWRCRYLANQMRIDFEKLGNIKYDLVYNLRPDFFCFDQIDHNLARASKKNINSVYVPYDWDFKSLNPNAIGDIMAFGSPEAMNKYYSLYLYAREYRDKKIGNHAETLLGYHFESQKINREFCPRNVAREYPYSEPEGFYLWESKLSKDEVLNALKIDNKFLVDQKPKQNQPYQNNFINFIKKINSFLKIIFFKKLINFIRKYF
tara:strand:+ start:2978 stop:3886 length:909 start_codon:yes stop_codon:yes gene_type:complete